jgi:hypothetical protein
MESARSRLIASHLITAAFVAITLGFAIWACVPKPKPNLPVVPKPSGPTTVRGFIAVTVVGVKGNATEGEEIYLPAIEVTLREVGTTNVSPASITDLSGRFTTQVKKAGQYEVCWKGAGFDSGCVAPSFSVFGRFQSLGTVLIPLPRRDRIAIFGTVRLADGGTPRAFDALANINGFAMISYLDAGKTQLEVPINNHDQYVLTGVIPGHDYWLRIREEKYDRRQRLRAGSGATQRYDFTIANSAPRLDPLVARDMNGVRVGTAAPGSTVELITRSSDRDGDPIAYSWRVSAGTLSSATDPNPKWTLPNLTGRHAATLIAYDGRGGYASQSVAVTVDPRGLEFSGRVTGTDAPAVPNATVEVNGHTTTTDPNGYFRLFVPDKQRFVMNIRKAGYGLSSSIYYDAVIGGTWQLLRASVQTVDPTRDVEVVNQRGPRDCPGPPSERLDWVSHPVLAQPHFQDGRGDFVSAPKGIAYLPGLPSPRDQRKEPRECGPGVIVRIPANSLADEHGQPPPGLVTVQLSTVDLQSPNQMPGNYTVSQGPGAVGVMQSWGAATIAIYSGNTQYNLKSGVTATVILPVDPGQIAAGAPLPATIPMLHYDETLGVWNQTGTASLGTVNGKPAYIAQVKHFSALNTDLIKQDQSCISVQNQNMPGSYDLEVTIPQTGGAAPVKRLFTAVTGNNVENVMLNLPKNTNIVMVPIRTTDPDPNKNNLPMGVFVVNTGAPQNPNWPKVQGGFANEPQGPPYYTTDANGNPNGACSTKVILKDLGSSFYPDPAQLLTGAFLHGLQSFAAVNLSDTDPAFPADVSQALRNAVLAASAAYRKAIDPRGLRTSFACFKQANGFPLKVNETCAPITGFTPPPVQVDTSAAYANTVDLGFGREMHCVKNGANTACYVSNYDSLVYTGPGQGTDVSKANKAVDGLNGLVAPDATVAMEFSPIEDFAAQGNPVTISDTQQVVKFFVFNAAGNPADKANLDGLGDRPVPQLCMVCHGGFIPNPTGSTQTALGVKTPVFRDPSVDAAGSRADVKLNAKFLPFDLKSLSYSTQAGFDRNSQEAAFKTLNEIVKVSPPPDVTDPTSSAISVLFDAWYPGNVTPQQDAAVPLWKSSPLRANFYTSVVARSCRTCHVTNAAPALRFDRPLTTAVNEPGFDDKLGLVQTRVCKQHVMPHARRTHDLFWTSINPSQPAQLQIYGDAVKLADPNNGWQIVGSPNVSQDLTCGNEYTQGGGVIVTNTAFSPVNAIFSGNCTGCHNDNAANLQAFAFLGLNTNAHAHIVGVNSWELQSMKRIAAGDTNNSYLLRKLLGTHTGLGNYQSPGPGGQMPLGGPFLGPTDINTISGWISAGAQP